MNILMLNAPFTPRFGRGGRWQASPRGNSLWYPIWLGYATGTLEKEGHQVRLIDAPADNISLTDLEKYTEASKPELIVLDTSTGSIFSDVHVAESLKKNNPRANICLVGPHATAVPDEVFEISSQIDFIARGEYEYTLRDLARCIENKGNLDDVLGISYQKDGTVIHNQPRPFIQDLDSLPFVSKVIKKHLNIRNYSLDFVLYPYTDIMTGRGCPFKCSFCLWPKTITGNRYRMRSLDNVFEEINYILREMPSINEISIDDDTFTIDKRKVTEFCERILKNNYKFSWSANCRPNVDDLDLLKLMKRAGCRVFAVGFESGSQKILNNIQKGIRVEEMKLFSRLCKKAGIQIHGDFVIGLPGETKETVRQTIELAKEIHPDTFQLTVAVPFPGTEFYRWLKENKYLVTENYNDWLDAKGSQNCVISYPELSREEIIKSVRRGILEYHLRAKFLRSAIIKIIKDSREFTKFYLAGKKFVKFIFERNR